MHVADASNPRVDRHIDAVRQLLGEIGIGDLPECLVLNKCDLLDPAEAACIASEYGGVPVSALRGEGLEELLAVLEAAAFPEQRPGGARGVDACSP